MSDLFAMYLGVIMGIILFIAGLWLKKIYIMIPSGFIWALVAIYCISVARPANLVFVWAFSGFAFVMAVSSFAAINAIREKPESPVNRTEEEEGWDSWNEAKETYNKNRERYGRK